MSDLKNKKEIILFIILTFILAFCILEINIVSASLNDGLVSYYNSEKYNSKGVYDMTLNDNFGYFKGGMTTNNIENSKYAYFNGIYNHMNFLDKDIFSNPNSFSASVWIKPYSGNFKGIGEGYINFLGKGITNNNEFKFRIYNSSNSANRPNRISFYVFNLSGGRGVGSYFQDSIKYSSEWIHITGVYNGTHTLIYKNGILRDSDYVGNEIILKNGNAPLVLGNVDLLPSNYFRGYSDELKMYNRALTKEEVYSNYLEGKGKLGL